MKFKNKYHARKTICLRRHLHDSKKEANRCDELCLLEKSRRIKALQFQISMLLQPDFKTKQGEHILAIHYVADFIYYENDHIVIEDVKGCRTPVYELKRKLLLKQYPDIEFREIY